MRWSPPELGQHAARRAEADLETAQANVDLALSRRDVIARVRALHATVLSLDAQIALARGAQEERERTRRLVAHRVDQQAATVVEQSTSEMDYLEAVAATQELEIQRRQAYDDLLQMLGLPPGSTVELSVEGATQCREPPGNAPAPRPVAEEDSLRLNAFEAELRTVDTERSRRWLELVPWPSYVQLSYVFRGDNDPAYWTLQFGVTLPLFDWKSADRQALAARRLRLEEEHRAEVAEVDRQMQHALTELAEQRVLVQRYREAALVLEEGLKHFSRSGNTIGLLQAGQLRARMLVTRRAHLRAELDCMLRQIKVDRLDCNRRSPRADGGG